MIVCQCKNEDQFGIDMLRKSRLAGSMGNCWQKYEELLAELSMRSCWQKYKELLAEVQGAAGRSTRSCWQKYEELLAEV